MKLHVVHGPPGTGKTTYLSHQCELAAEKYGPALVVVASLTRAAAAEVAGRRTPLPPANVATLHSHAYHAMKRPQIMETKDGLTAWNEWVGIASMRISTKFAADPENAEPEMGVFDEDGVQALNLANIMRQRMVKVEMWPPMVQRFWRKWTQFKAENGMVDFTDLIEVALADVDEMPQQPAVFMLDEAQDMSRLEFALAMKWGGRCEQMVIVGDQDQNLYQWRGTDPEAFTSQTPTTERTLSQSYRVPRAVHDVAVRWITQIADRTQTAYEPRKDEDGTVVDGKLRREQHTYKDPVSLMHAAIEDVEAGRTVMILGSCTYMLNPLVGELRKHGIPFWNPYRVKAGNWNPLRGGSRLLALVKPLPTVEGGEAQLWTWKDLRKWIDPLQSAGVLERGTKTMIESKCVVDRFGDGNADDIVPLLTVGAMFKPEHHSAVLSCDMDWWEKHLKHIDQKRQQYALTVARKRGTDALREQPKMIVGTIHSVKGGEADVVYLLPDLSGAAYFEGWRRGGDGRDAIIRQFYVGMTRARHELVLCAPSGPERVLWPS